MRNEYSTISVVVPILNEEKNVYILTERIIRSLQEFPHLEIIFVDDGSTDKSLENIKKIHDVHPCVKVISFIRNFGHQNALRAGLGHARGDCVISLDGDLQHPPEIIPELIHHWIEGVDVVSTIRKDVSGQKFLKGFTSRFFYKLMNSLSDIYIPAGSADFRLLDRKVIEQLNQMDESPMFFRGIIPWMGFQQTSIEYIPNKRLYGTTKYSFNKMLKFAIEGITGFSVRPLRLAAQVGIFFALLSFVYAAYALYIKIFTEKPIEGWASTLILISLIGGIQLISIGVLGEYLGKLFIEHKKRPDYIIKFHNL